MTVAAPAPLRLCFAAAHVVLLPGYRRLGHTLQRPGAPAEIAAHLDWPATLGLRRWLDDLGFGTAEAMDTAQRFHLGWDAARALVERTGALQLQNGFVAGAGTDHLPSIRSATDLVDGVVAQAHFIHRCGGIPMLLPMPWLAQQHKGERDYVEVYRAIVQQCPGPLLVHWLGPMFLPALQGYFPGDSFAAVMALDPGKVRGCKLSLLDAALELRVRRELLPREQIVLTGDDFHFGQLLLGGDPATPPSSPPPVLRHTTIGAHRVPLGDFSHALLGVFDAVAAPVQQALRALAAGDVAGYRQTMAACEALGQHLFAPPTQHYKAGLAFLAWLAGRQDNPMLVNREDLARDLAHGHRAAELAFACGALVNDAATRARLQAAERLRD